MKELIGVEEAVFGSEIGKQRGLSTSIWQRWGIRTGACLHHSTFLSVHLVTLRHNTAYRKLGQMDGRVAYGTPTLPHLCIINIILLLSNPKLIFF